MSGREYVTMADAGSVRVQWSKEAEQSVLGGLMLTKDVGEAGEALDAVLSVLKTAKAFFDFSHELIFQAIAALIERKSPADVVTVSEWLDRHGQLHECGGLSYLADLTQNTPSLRVAALVRYATIVHDAAVRRQMVKVAGEMTESACSPARHEAAELIEQSISSLEALATEADDDEFVTAAELGEAGLSYVEARYGNPDLFYGVPTGFAALDARWNGLKGGDLVVIGGRPSMGKTIFLLELATHAAQAGIDAVAKANFPDAGPVLVFSMEMSRDQLALRQQAMLGGIELGRLTKGQLQDEDWAKLSLASGALGEMGPSLLLDFRPALSLQQVRMKARKAKRLYGLSAVYIDYLQLMVGSGENRTQEISEISRGLKALAKELEVPVVVLSQLNRAVEQRPNKRPLMSDLRESGGIEQDADVIAFLYRDEYYNPESMDKGLVEVITAKCRMGEVGTDRLLYEGQYARMRDVAPEYLASLAAAKSEAGESGSGGGRRRFAG